MNKTYEMIDANLIIVGLLLTHHLLMHTGILDVEDILTFYGYSKKYIKLTLNTNFKKMAIQLLEANK